MTEAKVILNLELKGGARKGIKLSKEAYNYMIDSESCPDPKLKKDWKKLSITQKLQAHCKHIADSERATDFSFAILEE